MENLYENLGRIIMDPERYIRREEVEKLIYSRVNGHSFGSFSLVGLPRIGKSTVVNQLFSHQDDAIVVNLVLSTINENQVEKFFEKLARLIFRRLKKLSLITEEIEEIYEEFVTCDFERYGTEYFLEFIEVVVEETSYKLIIIIDEFDWASRLFKSSPHYFQVIREMAIQDIFQTAFVFVSRRLVEEIEMRMDGVSNLRQVLKISYLKPYSSIEVEDYFYKLSKYFFIEDDIKLLYKKYTGFYPYLMDILSSSLVDSHKGSVLTAEMVEMVYKSNISDFHEQYNHIKRLLQEEKLFDELLQIVFSMPFDIVPYKIQRLQNYGIIDKAGNIFSESFKMFLLSERGLSNYHHIWNRTEKSLKHISKYIYSEVYGDNWESFLRKKYKNHKLEKMINSAYFFKREEMKKHNQPDNTSFVDTIATSGLLYLIEEEWNHFYKLFDKSKEHWVEVFKPIKDVRNVIQHNREEVLDDIQIKQVILNCELIVLIIDEYFKQK